VRPLTVAVALGVVYVLWGSTSPAIKVAVASIPAFAMVALRFAAAGTILWTWSRLRRVPLPRAAEWRGAVLTGIMLLVASNGVFSWTLRFIPAGIGALFFALAPLWMAGFGFLLYRERLAPVAALGLIIGLGGMVYLYSPSGAQHLPLLPTVLGVIGSVAWAFGSMIQRRLAGSDVVQMSAMQMLVAALVLALLSIVSGERLALTEFTPSALGALLYLIVFGSIVGFSAFLWLMNNVPTTLASTYSYVNPVVSIVLGITLLHERFSWQLAAGAAVIIVGVAVMMLAPRPKPKPGARMLQCSRIAP